MFFRKRNEAPAEPSSPPPPAPPAAAAPVPPPIAVPAIPAAPAASVTPPPAVQNANPALSADEAKRRAQVSKQMTASLGGLTMLLMRSPTERQLTLADLEWMAVPAINFGQIALAEVQAKDTGVVSPVGAVLWAFVSPEVDARLSDLTTSGKLSPEEWRSGDIPWIVLAAGDNRILGSLLDKLKGTAFKGKLPKMRLRGSDGKVVVGTIDVRQEAPAA